jgi:hypothetical protein
MADPFHTTDVDLATFLTLRGYPFDAIQAKDERFADFVFPDSPPLWTLIREWHEGDCLVDARAFGKLRYRLMKDARKVAGA